MRRQEITAHDAAQRAPRRGASPTRPAGPPAATLSQPSPPAFHARDRLTRSPPLSPERLVYEPPAGAAASGDEAGEKAEGDTSPFAARNEIPRSPSRHGSAGGASFASSLADDDDIGAEPSPAAPQSPGSPPESLGDATVSRGRPRSDSEGSAGRRGASPLHRERLLATVEALAAAEAEVEATVEEAEAAAARATADAAAAAHRAEAARERARSQASRLGSGGSERRLQLSPEPRGEPEGAALPPDIEPLLRACVRSDVMAAAHRRISQTHGADDETVIAAFGDLFRFAVSLTRLGHREQSSLWRLLRETVDGASPRRYEGRPRGLSQEAAAVAPEPPPRSGSRSSIDDSSTARRAELRRLTQNLVSTATDRTAAALSDGGHRPRADSGGSTTWRTPGGLEYSSPPVRNEPGRTVTSPPTRRVSGGWERGEQRRRDAGHNHGHSAAARSPPFARRSPPVDTTPPSDEAAAPLAMESSPHGSVGAEPAAGVAAAPAQLPERKTEPATPAAPGEAWTKIEETPLRPPKTDGGGSASSGFAAEAGPSDDPFSRSEQQAGSGEPTWAMPTSDGPITVDQLRSNMHAAEPATPEGPSAGGADGELSAKRESKPDTNAIALSRPFVVCAQIAKS